MLGRVWVRQAASGWTEADVVQQLDSGRLQLRLADGAHFTAASSDVRAKNAAGMDAPEALEELEHIDDPVAFIETDLAPLTGTGTKVLVAVPAHQRLFGSHDEALGHRRRYARRELLDQVSPWMDVVEDGPLFTSLLLPRAVSVGLERLAPRRTDQAEHGVGHWTGGPLLTSIVSGALAADARVGRAAGRTLRLPGLSHWVFGVVR